MITFLIIASLVIVTVQVLLCILYFYMEMLKRYRYMLKENSELKEIMFSIRYARIAMNDEKVRMLLDKIDCYFFDENVN